ncbi:DUF4135 domain-containing protein [Metasolibacillus sp. FSL K6-0083]|uniref:DUF4135 domain-containing protein n=1 Tax=Metasolibacillus sp. FSL K6-0083 TaxID=2921416 RepID=UPI00315B0A28
MKNFVEDSCFYLNEEIIQISRKTLSYEFSMDISKVHDNINPKINNINDMSSFMDKYINLILIIDNIVEQSISCLKKIIKIYIKDIPMLINKKFIDEESLAIKTIKLVGDKHNNGERVAILETLSKKLVFKPRSLKSDRIFENLIILLNSTLKEERYINIYPRTIDCYKYGWVEYIDTQKQASLNKDHFASKLGVLTALFQVLNTSDIHEDNILIYASYPVVIDFETLAHNNTIYENKEKIDSKYILKSLLIESYSRNNLIYKARTINRLLNKNEMKLNDRLLKKEINPLFIIDENLESFFDGYEKGLMFIQNKKVEINELIYKYRNCISRFIPRNTSFYQNLINIMMNPILYRDFNKCKEFLRIILEDNKLNRIVEYEISSLLKCDVPYFYTKFNSVNLYHDKEIIDNFFKVPINKIIKSNIEENWIEELTYQKDIVYHYLNVSPKCTT